jgi:hypothetical protein
LLLRRLSATRSRTLAPKRTQNLVHFPTHLFLLLLLPTYPQHLFSLTSIFQRTFTSTVTCADVLALQDFASTGRLRCSPSPLIITFLKHLLLSCYAHN